MRRMTGEAAVRQCSVWLANGKIKMCEKLRQSHELVHNSGLCMCVDLIDCRRMHARFCGLCAAIAMGGQVTMPRE
jgi:hypothetical protein